MSPDPVIVALDKLEDCLPSRDPRLEACESNAFALECSEERLSDSVIPAVAFAAHTHRHTLFHQERLIRCTGVLASSVRVMEQPGLWPPLE